MVLQAKDQLNLQEYLLHHQLVSQTDLLPTKILPRRSHQQRLGRIQVVPVVQTSRSSKILNLDLTAHPPAMTTNLILLPSRTTGKTPVQTDHIIPAALTVLDQMITHHLTQLTTKDRLTALMDPGPIIPVARTVVIATAQLNLVQATMAVTTHLIPIQAMTHLHPILTMTQHTLQATHHQTHGPTTTALLVQRPPRIPSRTQPDGLIPTLALILTRTMMVSMTGRDMMGLFIGGMRSEKMGDGT